MGHEYCGIIEEVGKAVKNVKPGQFVIGSHGIGSGAGFYIAGPPDNGASQIGYQSSCQHRELVGGAQAPFLRVPLADGTLVATSDVPSEDLIPSLYRCRM
jgi:threonine dehydrogenase-like Zn-dependent dehydrogenase